MEVYEFQKKGIEFLKSKKQALLFDDPGLGKTCQALLALPQKSSTIVVCPASVKPVWEREIRKWRSDLIPIVCSGRKSFVVPKENEVVIINYDILPNFPPTCRRKIYLILDEVHAAKSTKSLRHRRIVLLRKYILGNGGSVYGLTGTPLLSRPDDTWGICSAIGIEKEAFGNYNNFLRVFNGIRVNFGVRFSKIIWRSPTPESITSIRRIGLGRNREQVLPELPTKTYETVTVKVKARDEFEKVAKIDLDNLEDPGVLSTAREAICTDKATESLPYLATLAESEPIVVFCSHVAGATLIANHFGTVPLSGKTTDKERAKLIDEFMAGKTNVIVGTILAMGVGLTLTRSNHVVFVTRDWTPALNKQAEDRVCRIGQGRGVIVTDILADHPVESILYKVLLRKQGIIDASIERARVGV